MLANAVFILTVVFDTRKEESRNQSSYKLFKRNTCSKKKRQSHVLAPKYDSDADRGEKIESV